MVDVQPTMLRFGTGKGKGEVLDHCRLWGSGVVGCVTARLCAGPACPSSSACATSSA